MAQSMRIEIPPIHPLSVEVGVFSVRCLINDGIKKSQRISSGLKFNNLPQSYTAVSAVSALCEKH